MNEKLRTVLISIFTIIFVYSAVRIVIAEIGYKKAEAIYEKSRDENFFVSTQSASVDQNSNKTEEYFPDVYINFKALKAANPDIVGWIWIPDTDVSFPLLYAEDNLKYLGYSYDMQRTSSGSIFMDYRNSSSLSDCNTVIYGHNMNDGSMFGDLKKYSDYDYLSDHSDLYIFTESSIFKYRIFAAYRTENDSKSYTFSFTEDWNYNNYIEYIKNCSRDSLINVPAEEAPLIMLSTCTSIRRSERLVVHASLIAEKKYENALLTA